MNSSDRSKVSDEALISIVGTILTVLVPLSVLTLHWLLSRGSFNQQAEESATSAADFGSNGESHQCHLFASVFEGALLYKYYIESQLSVICIPPIPKAPNNHRPIGKSSRISCGSYNILTNAQTPSQTAHTEKQPNLHNAHLHNLTTPQDSRHQRTRASSSLTNTVLHTNSQTTDGSMESPPNAPLYNQF
ncbi:hypothetical protein IWZ00DRAFT_486552 [Phyllosticta capitalensis]